MKRRANRITEIPALGTTLKNGPIIKPAGTSEGLELFASYGDKYFATQYGSHFGGFRQSCTLQFLGQLTVRKVLKKSSVVITMCSQFTGELLTHQIVLTFKLIELQYSHRTNLQKLHCCIQSSVFQQVPINQSFCFKVRKCCLG